MYIHDFVNLIIISIHVYDIKEMYARNIKWVLNSINNLKEPRLQVTSTIHIERHWSYKIYWFIILKETCQHLHSFRHGPDNFCRANDYSTPTLRNQLYATTHYRGIPLGYHIRNSSHHSHYCNSLAEILERFRYEPTVENQNHLGTSFYRIGQLHDSKWRFTFYN